MTRIILIRHGQSIANLERVYAGHTDIDLSELGKVQAQKTAEYVADKYKIDKIYASDLKRAYNTAKPISDSLKIEIIPDERLREIFAGEWEGLKFDYLMEEYKDEYGVWKNDIGNARCTGGESVKELAERILAKITEIAKENDGKTVVIATHATPIRSMQCLWQGMSFDDMKDVAWVSNASVTEAIYENGEFSIVLAGYDEHLKDLVSELPANV